MNPLESLADYLRPLLTGVNVYGYPPDTFSVPAVVMSPASPFQQPYTQGGPSAVAWGIEAKVLVSRSQPRDALRALYELRETLTPLLDGAPSTTRWLGFDDIDTIQVGDTDYLSGTLTLVIVETE